MTTTVPPTVPPPDATLLAKILDTLLHDPQIVANYATLGSALTALIVAIITFRQLRTNRTALDLNRAALDESRRQASISEQALVASLTEARKDRLNQRAPNVSVVILPGTLEFVISEEMPDNEHSLLDQFEEKRRGIEPESFCLTVSRTVPEYDCSTHVWLTGEMILRNEGDSSAVIAPFSFFFERVDGTHVLQLDETSFLLEPGARTVIRWLHTYSVVQWMRKAHRSFTDKLAHSANAEHEGTKQSFKHLGIDEDIHFLSITSSTIPALGDHYRASLTLLPLSDEEFEDRDSDSVYKLNPAEPFLELVGRVRSYPDADEDYEREPFFQ